MVKYKLKACFGLKYVFFVDCGSTETETFITDDSVGITTGKETIIIDDSVCITTGKDTIIIDDPLDITIET